MGVFDETWRESLRSSGTAQGLGIGPGAGEDLNPRAPGPPGCSTWSDERDDPPPGDNKGPIGDIECWSELDAIGCADEDKWISCHRWLGDVYVQRCSCESKECRELEERIKNGYTGCDPKKSMFGVCTPLCVKCGYCRLEPEDTPGDVFEDIMEKENEPGGWNIGGGESGGGDSASDPYLNWLNKRRDQLVT